MSYEFTPALLAQATKIASSTLHAAAGRIPAAGVATRRGHAANI